MPLWSGPPSWEKCPGQQLPWLLIKTRPNLDEVQLLFVQNAKDAIMGRHQLTLIGVNPTTIFFSDRPKRIAGHMSTEDFVFDWQEGTGKESFHTVPPNATLSVFGQDEIVDVVVELKNPRLEEDRFDLCC